MSVSSRSLSAIRSVIKSGLVGQTINGLTTMTLSLTAAEDDKDPSLGATEIADGGVVVRFVGGSTIGGPGVPAGVAGSAQEQWRYRYVVSVSYRVDGVRGEVLDTDTCVIAQEVTRLISAALNPTSGANYTVASKQILEPQRDARNTAFYVQSVIVDVVEHWTA